MSLQHYVQHNQKVMELIKDKVPGRNDVDMYYGTLDYATARFNTILIKLSQDRLLEDRLKDDVEQCFTAIQDFYKNVQRYRFWPNFTKPFIKMILHKNYARLLGEKLEDFTNSYENETFQVARMIEERYNKKA